MKFLCFCLIHRRLDVNLTPQELAGNSPLRSRYHKLSERHLGTRNAEIFGPKV